MTTPTKHKAAILQAIRNCIEDDGLSLFGNIPTMDQCKIAWGSRIPVFWQLHRNKPSLIRLFLAIASGTVPILLSPDFPPVKRKQLQAQYPGFGWYDGHCYERSDSPVAVDERILLVFLTSGSTGEPKLIAATDAALSTGVHYMHETQRLHEIERTAVCLPIHFAFSFINQLLWALVYRRKVELACQSIIAPRIPGFIDGTDCQMCCLVPQQLRIIAKLGALHPASNVSPLKVLNVGGSPFPFELLESLRSRFPAARVINNYGCTEALTRVASGEVTDSGQPPTLVGRAFPTLEFRIGSAHSASVDVGPIEFRGSSASIGYLRPNGSIEEVKWITTGDWGKLVGNDIFLMGRRDQVYKVGSERFSLIEVEHCLCSSPAVSEAVCWIPTGDRSGEDCVLAVICGKANPDAVLSTMKARLMPLALPKIIYQLDRWPFLSNGKTDRKEVIRICEHGAARALWRNPRYLHHG